MAAVPMSNVSRPFEVEEESDRVRAAGVKWEGLVRGDAKSPGGGATQNDVDGLARFAEAAGGPRQAQLATDGASRLIAALIRVLSSPLAVGSPELSYVLVLGVDLMSLLARDELADAAGSVQDEWLEASGALCPVPDLLTDDTSATSSTTGERISPVRDVASRVFPLLPAGVESPVYTPLLRILARAGSDDPASFFVVCKLLAVVQALVRAGLAMGRTQLVELMGWAESQITSASQRESRAATASASASSVDRALASASAIASTMESNSSFVEPAVGLLQSLLRYNSLRTLFWDRARAFDAVLALVAPESNQLQLLYQALNVLWLLSYSEVIADEMPTRGPVIPVLLRVLKAVRKENEKIFRMVLGIVHNLVTRGGAGVTFVEVGMLKVARSLAAHEWKDTDINDTAQAVLEALQGFEEDASTFGQYKEEVLSGQLTWSPVHKSEAFWRINVSKLEWEEWRLIRVLIQLISSSTDSTILSVAAWDLGEFVRLHPYGKRVLEDLGGKSMLMNLMASPDEAVQKEALFAVQKMLVKNYSFAAQA